MHPAVWLQWALDRKLGRAAPLPFCGGAAGSPSNTKWAEAYLRTKWHLNLSSHLAITNMGRKLWAVPLWGGVAGSPFNTMWPGPRPSCVPNFMLIRPTVWPQYTNFTERQADRQTDRQTGKRSDSIWRTVFGRPFIKRFALCYRSVVCLSVSDVRARWPNGWTDQDEIWHAARPQAWPHCVKWRPSSPSPKGHSPQFSALICYG